MAMIWQVEGTIQLFICSECKERWVGQGGEPRTKEWLDAHDKDHLNFAGLVIPQGTPPLGFGRGS